MANFKSKISMLRVHESFDLYDTYTNTIIDDIFPIGIYRYFAYKGPPGQLGFYELRVYAANEFEAYICLLDLGYESIEIL